MPKPLKVIFLEDHMDPATTTIKKILPELIAIQLVNTHALNYKAIDPSDTLHASLALIDLEESDEITIEAQGKLKELTLKRSEAMCEAYARAQENTFGVMGYAHVTEIMDALNKLSATEKDRFVFIYIYNGDQFDQDEEFLENVKKNTFSSPLHCVDTSKKILVSKSYI